MSRSACRWGLVNNTPISIAIESGATEVWVLSTGYSCALARPPETAIGMTLQAIALLVQQRLRLETQNTEYPVPVHLIPPPCPITVGPTDFSEARALIDQARSGTNQWIDNGKPFALPLGPHHHT